MVVLLQFTNCFFCVLGHLYTLLSHRLFHALRAIPLLHIFLLIFTVFPLFFCPSCLMQNKTVNFKVCVPCHTLGMLSDNTHANTPTQPNLEGFLGHGAHTGPACTILDNMGRAPLGVLWPFETATSGQKNKTRRSDLPRDDTALQLPCKKIYFDNCVILINFKIWNKYSSAVRKTRGESDENQS